MRNKNFPPLIVASLLAVAAISGCETNQSSSTGSDTSGLSGPVKSQGVYTTLMMSDSSLDMPASGYLQKSSFGPGEIPEAVIVGYGSYNQQQSVTLELIEADTGRSIFSINRYASYGMAVMQPLAIRLSGNYQLRLTSAGADLDHWEFTVTRTNSTGVIKVDSSNPSASYGKGNFSIYFGPDSLPEAFSQYDDKLIYSMVNAVTQEPGSMTNEMLFAQRFPGKVVIRCNLDFQGKLSGLKVLENGLDDDCATMIENALLARSPYDAWTDDVHQKFGADNREITMTINCD